MIITDSLPQNSKLNQEDNPFTDLINGTIGTFFELFEDEINTMNEELFIQESSKYLDLFGRDYDIPRKEGETDEHYRTRLITLITKHFTINTLYYGYDAQLITYNANYSQNMLLSDNHYLNNEYFIICDDSVWNTIKKKYISNLRRLVL